LGLKVKGVFDWFNKLDPVVKENSVKFIAILALVGPLLIGFGKITKAIAGLRATVLLLNSALLANPYVIVATGIAALTMFIVSQTGAFNKSTQAIKRHNDQMEYNAELNKAWKKYYRDNLGSSSGMYLDSGKFEKEFKKQWDSYNATATNSMEQIAITKQKYQEQEKGNDEKTLATKRIRSEEEIKAAQDAADKIQKIEKDRYEQWEDLQEKRRDKDYEVTEAIHENRERAKREDQESADRMVELQASQREKELKEDQEAADRMLKLQEEYVAARIEGEIKIANLSVDFTMAIFDLFRVENIVS